ncbi:DUF1461 domain-containing protein [Candidatus Woesearchaeota archaeon]|nr:DUF1461 domain-containing protein [Candidatus Woesearchaeota archaeon]
MAKFIKVIFSVFSVVFFLLLSYYLTVAFWNVTPNQQQTMDLLKGKGTVQINYTVSEVSHLEDVARVMNIVDVVFVLLFIGLMGILYWKKRELPDLLFYGGISTAIITLFILLMAIFGFDALFTAFHTLFFPQGNWIFPADSLLIQTFPSIFFIKISIIIFLVTLFEGSLFIFLSFYLRHVQRG